MTTLANAIRDEKNYTLTENAAIALKSTGNALLDLFAVAGALRVKSESEVETLFQNALSEDRLLATKLMFYTRDVRGGLGERETFRRMLKSLAKSDPEIVIKNLELIAVYGRYDDYYTLIGTKAEHFMWIYLAHTIRMDVEAMKRGEKISLCAKWLKSINTSSAKSVELGRETAKQFHMTETGYRKVLSALRKYIDVTEVKMSGGDWNKIVYSQVPSNAMKTYRKAFGKHDPEGFTKYITNVKAGVEEIKSTTLYPYDILQAANLTYQYRHSGRNSKFTIDRDDVLEAQWKALPNYIKKAVNVLVMADTSGSMEGLPMATSIGLAIYFAERNQGAYHNLFMTFSEHPEFVELKGDTLYDKVRCVETIVANTDLEAAFDLILKVAVDNGVTQELMPKALVVISDMQFDAATGRGRQTFHKSMEDKFRRAGYTMPIIIYWQVQARQEALQVKADDKNVMLVSGQSTSTFKSILNNIGTTPYEFMVETLNSERYQPVTI